MKYYAVFRVSDNALQFSGGCPDVSFAEKAGAGQYVVEVQPGDIVPGRSYTYNRQAQTLASTDNLGVQRALVAQTLATQCTAVITGGFASSALGAPHFYPSDDVSQMNLLHACVTPGLLSCSAGDVWTKQSHTVAQAQVAHNDFVAIRDAARSQLSVRIAALTAANTAAAISAVVW